ncbi:hypothetical protein CPC16_010641 [Podila verticillata]|nr:hypothetical protein CPC16_010641 [Podila verticillata]
MSSQTNSSANKSGDTQDPPSNTPISNIPFEILGEIVQYLVAANTIVDLFHLSLTCKDLHASVWDHASDIWRVVWTSLYDELEPKDIALAIRADNSISNKYQYHLRKRLCVFRDVEAVAQALRDDIVPWDTIAYGYTHGTNEPKPGQKLLQHEDIAETVMDMIGIAAEHDPYALDAIYRDKYESFRYLRGSVFRREDGCSYGRLAVEQIPRLWYPWSICQIMYMVLFCGPSVMYYVDKEQEAKGGDTVAKKRKIASNTDWLPSWFNFGAGHITPVPLTIPPSIKQQQRSFSGSATGLAGSWTGYYAYSDEESADLMALQRTTAPEFACRGIALDARMKLVIVNWTTTSSATTTSSPTVARKIQAANGDEQPLYLTSDLDVQAFKLVDRYFMPFRQGSSLAEEEVSSMDDLEDKTQWQYQRIFSGRGTDIFGEYGVRGILSEQSGLVRLVKNYFRHSGGATVLSPEEAATLLEGDEPWKAYMEFGNHRDQLKFMLNSGSSVWYYRGQLMPPDEGEKVGRGTGYGIQGLWFTDVDSGPFWIYNTDASRTRAEEV